MTERRELFGRADIKDLAQAYESLVEELNVVYWGQDADKIAAAEAATTKLLVDWGMWDDDYGWIA
jgi:hypothetical protein